MIIKFRFGLPLPGWLRKLSIRYLQNIPSAKRKTCPTLGLHVAELFGTNRRMSKRQKAGAFKLDSVTSSHPRRRKISDPKTRANRTLESCQANCLVETTQTLLWVDDALQPWMANHLVEVAQTMIPATRRYCANRGEWLLRYEVINCGN